MRKAWLIGAVMAIVLATAGCKHRQPPQEGDLITSEVGSDGSPTGGTTPIDPHTNDIAPATAQFDYMVMNFRAEVEGVQATGQVRVARDSVLWVTAYKIIELGRAKATQDSVWIEVPLMGKHFAGTYAELETTTGKHLNYDRLQTMLLSPQASEYISQIAASMGFAATVKLGKPQIVDHTEFPMKGK